MKKMMLILQLMTAHVMTVYCQQQAIAARNTMVPQQLEICYQKTTSLIFPSAIKSVDRGSGDVLVQKPEGVENVLKVKAAKENFPETNLTVITGDGQFYSFNVAYVNSPAKLVIQPGRSIEAGNSNTGSQAIFSDDANNEGLVKSRVAQASVSKRNISRVQDKSAGMKASLRGLYTANNMFLYKLVITNGSNIDYNIAAIRFFIEDRKKVKRVATQQVTIEPISITGSDLPVKAHREQMVIVAASKQTLGSNKHLIIEIDEKNGGRKLTCKVSNKVLLKAKRLKPAY